MGGSGKPVNFGCSVGCAGMSVSRYSVWAMARGWRENAAGAVSVLVHGKGNVGAKSKSEVVAEILAADSRTTRTN
jgi:hypothetical protein